MNRVLGRGRVAGVHAWHNTTNAMCGIQTEHEPVAQWLAHSLYAGGVGGSIPSRFIFPIFLSRFSAYKPDTAHCTKNWWTGMFFYTHTSSFSLYIMAKKQP
jgi:hypothetical protein